MKKLITTLLLCCTIVLVLGQEFPIATGGDTTFALGGSFDGTKYLIAIKGDNQSINNATAQFVSTTGDLIGSRISIGSMVSNQSMGINAAFDGTNFLIVWYDNFGNVVGQFLSPNGNNVGTQITIATNVSLSAESALLSYNAGSYFVCYLKGFNNQTHLWGRKISPNGTLGNDFQISNNYTREASISFDGTKYLVAYVENTTLPKNDIYARFVSASGSLIGNEITVASGNYQRDNPISLAFDGTNFLLAYHEQEPSAQQWFLYGKFIDTNGNLLNSINICDSSLHPFLPMVSFGNNNYLITWTELINGTLMGQWYSVMGTPNGSPFVLFDTLNNKIPFGATVFANNTFFAITTRLDNDFTNGDVYGKFLSSTTGLVDDIKQLNKALIYPNPASDIVTLNIENTNNSDLTMIIYNLIGAIVKTEKLNQNQRQINIGDLSNGIYMIEIRSKEFKGKQKLIIHR